MPPTRKVNEASVKTTKGIIRARARATVLNMQDCCTPLDAFQKLSARSDAEGAMLMESAAQGSPGGKRSLLIPYGVVRLIVRGRDVQFYPLSEDGVDIISKLDRQHRYKTVPEEPSAPDLERILSPSVLDAVRDLVSIVADEEPNAALPPGVYGALSFELVDNWERFPPRKPDPWNEPDINMVLALDAVVFDHVTKKVSVVTRSLVSSGHNAADARHARLIDNLTGPQEKRINDLQSASTVEEKQAESDVTDEYFLASVQKFLNHIQNGDIFQGVLSRGLTMKSLVDPITVYSVLRERNPSPYMFHLNLGDGVLLGASPETCIKVDAGQLEIRPIAGTSRRGFKADGTIDGELDSRLAVGLLLDPKEQAEHAMLVDLARNDVARVSIPGTRKVSEPFTIEKYSHVQHLVSSVTGQLSPEFDALHAYRAAANMGTLTGAPKLRAMELIRETEPFARGFYGGAVGYLLQDGTFDSCIVIRSLRYRKQTKSYHTRAGAGIVAASIPERELAETKHKARACREALTIAESIS